MEELSGSPGFNVEELRRAYKVSTASFKKMAIFPAVTIIMFELVRRSGIHAHSSRPFGNFFLKAIDSELYRYVLIIVVSVISTLAAWLNKSAVFAGKYRSLAGKEKLAAFKYLQGYPEPLQALMALHQTISLACMLPVLFGFVIYWRSLNPLDYYLCLVVTVGLLWHFYPRYDEWEAFMRNPRLHGAGQGASKPADPDRRDKGGSGERM